MAKTVRGVSGRKVTSKNAIRRAKAVEQAKKKKGRPSAYLDHPQLLDRDYLDGLYSGKNLTITQIAEMLKVSKETVRKAMVFLNLVRRTPGSYKTTEGQPRRRSPRSKPVLTDEERQLTLDCPTCGQRQWYTPLKSDTWLCNECGTWFDITCVDGALVAEEAHSPE